MFRATTPIEPPPPDVAPTGEAAVVSDQAWAAAAVDVATPVDFTKTFVCPTLTPLYYTPAYADLTAAQRLRYNQLTAVSFNDLVLFFERTFAAALRALLADPDALDDALRARVERFAADERRHCVMWRGLNRSSAAGLSGATGKAGDGRRRGDYQIVRVGRPMAAALGWVAARPRAFPVVVLAMLLLEEHSIEVARRCGRVPADQLEPRYAAAHRAHLADEARHVNVDRELIARLLDPLRGPLRRANAAAFRGFVRRLWLRPTGAAVRVVDALAGEFPELRPARGRIARQLRGLDRDPGYRRMMFSPQATPLTFAVLRAHPEFDPGRHPAARGDAAEPS